MKKKMYFIPEIELLDGTILNSLCQTSTSETGIEDMPEQNIDFTIS